MRDNLWPLVLVFAVSVALSSCSPEEGEATPGEGANAKLETTPDIYGQGVDSNPGTSGSLSARSNSGSMPSSSGRSNVPEGAYRATGRPVSDQVLANEIQKWEQEQASAPQTGPEHEVPPETVVKSGQAQTYTAQDPTASH